MSYNLFLDDQRDPSKTKYFDTRKNEWLDLPPYHWVVVRNFNEFVECIKNKGMPRCISFDHDLDREHYVNYFIAQSTGVNDLNYSSSKEKTGFHAARWLVEYCLDYDKPLPDEIYLHTFNPLGRENIKSILENYREHYKNSRPN